MDNVDPFAYDNIAENGEKGEDGRKTGRPVKHEEGNMIDLEAIGEIAHASATLISMRDDDDFVTPVPQLRRQLIDVALDAAWLWEKEVTNHGNVVCGRHGCWLVPRSFSRGCSRRWKR